ncbi:gamma conglutin 1-like [Vicia villosa]|uniref:gamma conglutin 1-like n=1 Tax=Vicia villosa TaxID=3911 RepID=UPI00273B8E2E|nr:gamma conglutin 1-like [Vicia villosa]
MASFSILHFLLTSLFWSFLLVSSKSLSHPPKPNLLVLPVQQDPSTGLHWTNIHKRTPITHVPVLIDLNGKHVWINCEQHYSSSTYQAPFCHSTQCSRANAHTCQNNTCVLISANPITQQTAAGKLAQDVLGIYATSGSKPGPMVTVPQFLFSCAPSFLAQKGLPNNVQGVAGLGHSPISLPNQLFSNFGLQHQFSTCLTRNPNSNGAILFGDAPNNYNKNPNIFKHLVYTPLTITQQGEYRIQVTSIRVNHHNEIPVSGSISSNYQEGVIGETLISTTIPYTTLHHIVYQALIQIVGEQIPKQAQVNPVAPFGLCYDPKKILLPLLVEFVLDKHDVAWAIDFENLWAVQPNGVYCLGFVNGGLKPKAVISIGSHQLEENVLVFDLVKSRLGFNNFLRFFEKKGIHCSDLFDFTNAP